MVKLKRPLIMCDTSALLRKLPDIHPKFSPKPYHQQQLQQNFTASVCITNYNSGKEQAMNLYQKNGDGGRAKGPWSQWGWRESEGSLVPVATNLLPAPEDLLHIIRCNCQTQ